MKGPESRGSFVDDIFRRMVAADTKRDKAQPPPMYCTCVLEEDVLTGKAKCS